MITLYTSVGRYELRKNENGEKQPIVKVDQKEMALSREELLLWSMPDVGDSDERRSKNLFFEEGCEDGRFSGTL